MLIAGEYGRGKVHTNTLEGYFSIFKRGMKGIYQHCSEKHLHRYVAEFDFRYNNRVALGVGDKERSERACRYRGQTSPLPGVICGVESSGKNGSKHGLMTQIKLRVKLNEGRTGAPMDKLGEVSQQLEKFLRALAADLSIESKKGEWLAINFENGSLNFDAALQTEVKESAFRRFNESIEFIADYDPETEGSNGLVSDLTLLEYGRIGEHIAPDEIISLGMYATPGSRKPKKWRQVSYRTTTKMRQAIETPIESYGSVQGSMYSWTKGGNSPNFQIRELSTEVLIKCSYNVNLYSEIHDSWKDERAIVFVTGEIKYDRVNRQIAEMRAERLDRFAALSESELESFFGSAPNLTGGAATSEFMRSIRTDG